MHKLYFLQSFQHLASLCHEPSTGLFLSIVNLNYLFLFVCLFRCILGSTCLGVRWRPSLWVLAFSLAWIGSVACYCLLLEIFLSLPPTSKKKLWDCRPVLRIQTQSLVGVTKALHISSAQNHLVSANYLRRFLEAHDPWQRHIMWPQVFRDAELSFLLDLSSPLFITSIYLSNKRPVGCFPLLGFLEVPLLQRQRNQGEMLPFIPVQEDSLTWDPGLANALGLCGNGHLG